ERAFATPVVPVLLWSRLPLIVPEAGDDAFFNRARIDLTKHCAPAALARKLEDLAGGVAVGEDRVVPVGRRRALQLCERVTLKPLVALADQLPTVLARE